MPICRNRQPPVHNLSWFSAPRCTATLRRILGTDARNHRRLEQFRHHIRAHNIPYFNSSHQVFVLGPHSRQYFRTSLRSLLTLDYVPLKVKIPGPSVPHDCFFCPNVNPIGSNHQRPFEYILAGPRSRGQPRRETVLPVDSDESDSSSDPHWTRATPLHLTGLPLARSLHQTTTRSPPLPPPPLYPRLPLPPNKASLTLPGSSLAHRFHDANLHRNQARGQVGLNGRTAGFNSKGAVSEQEEVAGGRGYGHNYSRDYSHCGDPNQLWEQGRLSSRDLSDGSRHATGQRSGRSITGIGD
jgi:hypothetical protein